MSSETPFCVGMGVSKTFVLRFNIWIPSPDGLPDNPILITALLFRALVATPQFWQEPPEKLANAEAPLARVLVKVVPVIRYTSVLFPTQTVCPVAGLEEHELVTLGVAIVVADTGPSTFTAWTPVAPHDQQPLGTYDVTVPGLLGTNTPSELVGRQAESVAFVCVSFTLEQLLLLKSASPGAASLKE